MPGKWIIRITKVFAKSDVILKVEYFFYNTEAANYWQLPFLYTLQLIQHNCLGELTIVTYRYEPQLY